MTHHNDRPDVALEYWYFGVPCSITTKNLETSGCNAGGGTRRTTTTRSTFHPLLGANAEGNAGGSCRGMQVEILPAVQRKPAWATTTRVLALHAVGGLLLVGPTVSANYVCVVVGSFSTGWMMGRSHQYPHESVASSHQCPQESVASSHQCPQESVASYHQCPQESVASCMYTDN